MHILDLKEDKEDRGQQTLPNVEGLEVQEALHNTNILSLMTPR